MSGAIDLLQALTVGAAGGAAWSLTTAWISQRRSQRSAAVVEDWNPAHDGWEEAEVKASIDAWAAQSGRETFAPFAADKVRTVRQIQRRRQAGQGRRFVRRPPWRS